MLKEKLKLILSLIITPALVVACIVIAIVMRDKLLLVEATNASPEQTQVLNVINHTHNV